VPQLSIGLAVRRIMLSSTEIIASLDVLIARCKQGEHGFLRAEQQCDHEQWGALCAGYARQRAKLILELQGAIERLGGEPAPEIGTSEEPQSKTYPVSPQSLGDRGHAGSHQGAFLAECEADEQATKDAYQQLLEQELPVNIRMLIQRQYGEVKAALARLQGREATLSW
jgi:uncharacterized protein (TIGR02284 family)